MGGKSNPISDVLKTVTTAVGDTFGEAGKVLSGDIQLDPFIKQKEEAAREKKKDEAQKAAAAAKQKSDAEAQVKVKAANREAQSGGTSIILGGKRKKKSGGSVSSGLGLSVGATGLQT